MQIFKIAMNIPKDVGWTLQEDTSGFIFQYDLDLLVQLDNVFGKLLRLEIGDMFVWTTEHVLYALNEGLFGGGFIGEGVENGLGGDGGIAAHSSSFGEKLW